MPTFEPAYYELDAAALTRGDPEFIHQHIVCAYTAQTADASTKTLALAFALIGLYLHVERRFTGRQVQRAHMDLARFKRQWPQFPLPTTRGTIRVQDVLSAPEGPQRDQAIENWCASVWDAYAHCRPDVVALLQQFGLDAPSPSASPAGTPSRTEYRPF